MSMLVQTEITDASGKPDETRPFLPEAKREYSVSKQETDTMPKSPLMKGESDVEVCEDNTCPNKDSITSGSFDIEDIVLCPKSGKPCRHPITKRPCTLADQVQHAGTQDPLLREAGVITDPKAKRQQEVDSIPQTTTTGAFEQVPIFDKTTSHTTPTKDAVLTTFVLKLLP
uniref:Uncharacterized protein LOC114338359 n=1 Tax=Diabrotica virgifera virgifera TaxID=50390 RepID=A0A6P7GEJ2_DIAVI